jgi:predicted metalloprotease
VRFNPKARLDARRVRDSGRGGGGGGGAMGGAPMRIPLPGGARAGGGIGLVVIIVVVLLLQVFGGIDLTGSTSGGSSSGYSSSRFSGDTAAYDGCQTGQDANDHPTTCGVVAVENSLVDYWRTTLPQQAPNASFQTERAIDTFSGQTSTGCGQASAAMGPFYCPTDQTIYFDPTFFKQILQQQLHGPSGAFVEPYVIAHEFGHHIQNLLGLLEQGRDTGAEGGAVRTELQADCFAGVWGANAVDTGFLEPITPDQVNQALNAASVIGDDRIQEQTQGQVNPETWTHGSSEQRQQWFSTGLEAGSADACDTFNADL